MKTSNFMPTHCGRNRELGSAMIEFALSLAFLTSLFLGTWQFGYTFFLYSELEQAVRAGARYASVQPYHSANATPTGDYLTAVQNVVVYGTASPGNQATAVVSGLTPKQVGLSVTFTNNAPSAVTVYITGYTVPASFGNVTLTNKPVGWFPYAGMFGPP